MYFSLNFRWPMPFGPSSFDERAAAIGGSISTPASSAFAVPVPRRPLPPQTQPADHALCPCHCYVAPPPRLMPQESDTPWALRSRDHVRCLLAHRDSTKLLPSLRGFADPLKLSLMHHHFPFVADDKSTSPFELNYQYSIGKKLFTCTHCRYVTDRKNNLKRHVSTMHQNSEKTLECCGVAFGNKSSLRDHVVIFHSSGYLCRYCGRNFCRKALLKRHLTVHSGQKDYVCETCDYATSHKSNLERHRRIHERQDADDIMSITDNGAVTCQTGQNDNPPDTRSSSQFSDDDSSLIPARDEQVLQQSSAQALDILDVIS